VKKPTIERDAASLSPSLRRYFYFTAAVTGAAIMIVEILGAKMLAPFFGTSHFVWTAQIAVTLVGLAAGYYAGGRLVDLLPRARLLFLCILAAAVYLGFSVVFVESMSLSFLKLNLAAGALLTSTFLYFVPLGLLAMVGPFAVRVLTESVHRVGGNVGRLTAVSTLGSFLGTMLIGYVLIPLLPNSLSMYSTSGLLAAVSLGYFVLHDRRGPLNSAAVALFVFAGLICLAEVRRHDAIAHVKVDVLFEGNSNFGQLQVVQLKETRQLYYFNDGLLQNTYDADAKKSISPFSYLLHGLARAYTAEIKEALCIGMGVGIVPMTFVQEGAAVDVVEINPAIVPVARRFFDCEPERFRLHVGDGRQFLHGLDRKYDAIVLDAFLGDSSPGHLMTREAFAAMRAALNPGGTLVVNTFGEYEEGREFASASIERTLRAVFRSVRIHGEGVGNGNVYYAASDREELKTLRGFDHETVHPSIRIRAMEAFEQQLPSLVEKGRGIVLRDDYNPVDFYDAANREESRRRTVEWLQRM